MKIVAQKRDVHGNKGGGFIVEKNYFWVSVNVCITLFDKW